MCFWVDSRNVLSKQRLYKTKLTKGVYCEPKGREGIVIREEEKERKKEKEEEGGVFSSNNTFQREAHQWVH